ncbi:hypothetical protein C8R43DRAFT_307030 [Mycena crocata]|nr:hypothetical protein C8R43DRAFT_307030 [Mycena crocata]
MRPSWIFTPSNSSLRSSLLAPISFDTPPVDGQHNEKLAINRLPPEILAEIFIFVCEASELSDDSWVACSYVCALWRQIALDTPQLWSHVIFSSPKWTRECIDRAKSSLLIIEASLYLIEDLLVCETLTLADRIGRITLRFFHMSAQLSDALGGPFPKLSSLSIDSSSFWMAPYITVKPDGQPYPRLQDLVVRSELAFSPYLPSQLVSLEMMFTSGRIHGPWGTPSISSEILGWDSFAEALQLLVELEILTLGGFPVPSTSASSRVHLPRLRDLHLSGTPALCTSFLEAIECPKLRRYYLNLSTVTDTGPLLQAVFSSLDRPPKSMFLHRKYGTFHPVSYSLPPFPDPSFYQHADLGFVYEPFQRTGTFDICFHWTSPLTDPELAAIFGTIADTAPLECLEWLLLENWNISPAGAWPGLLRRLERLQTLVVCGLPPSGLLWDLVRQLEAPADIDASSTPPNVLPALTEFALSCVDCSAGGFMPLRPPDGAGVTSYYHVDGARFLEVLVCYLELRATTTPLRKLKMVGSRNFTGAEIKLLRRLVGAVEWDGMGLLGATYDPNGDEFFALTINHDLLGKRRSYEDVNLGDEERWRRQHWQN